MPELNILNSTAQDQKIKQKQPTKQTKNPNSNHHRTMTKVYVLHSKSAHLGASVTHIQRSLSTALVQHLKLKEGDSSYFDP